MRWFDAPSHRTLYLGAYVQCGFLAVAEAAILWLALHPEVHPDYRAFYIDRTTTCLNRPTAGTYVMGETVSFRSGDAERSQALKVCGWTDPAGDGAHSLGEMSRLRVDLANARIFGDSLLSLELSPVLKPDTPVQDVLISVNGVRLHRARLTRPEPTMVNFEIPQSVVGLYDSLEIQLDYPNSIPTGPRASNTHNRAVKLSAFRLELKRLPTTDGPS